MRTRIVLVFALALVLSLLPGASAFADGGVHVVRAGETLSMIAQKYGVSATALARANGITNPNFIRIGQRLAIPGGGGAVAGSAAGSSGGAYVVRSGDTLGAIAKRFGVSVAALVSTNGLANPNRIYMGMTLRIPGASGGGATRSGVTDTRFVVSISSQHCWLYQGGVLVGDWRCSTGRRGAGTATGTFRVQSKIGNAYGSAWNFWMPYWLGIYWAGGTENGIHGLPYNKQTGARTWAGMVGTPITYGCVMLDDANAKKLWNIAYIGMPVVITR